MTSRYVKPTFAILAALALSLAFAARTIAAPAAGLNWEVHGTGSGSASLTGVSSSGPAMPQHVGNATYSLSLSMPGTVGTLCNEAGIISVLHYNGTYRITAGDGRFVGVAGGGSLTATFGSTHFIKIDGTI